MATQFKKGQSVKVKMVVPHGEVQALRMDDNGVVYCLLKWVDHDGENQERWFSEDVLVAASE